MIGRIFAKHSGDNPAIGCSQYTPNQAFFVDTNARGRWAHSPFDKIEQAVHIRTTPDGTVDMIRLESGIGGWTHLGGQGGLDIRAGRF
jgi:hypothetical protein